ncbi:hypothetical protein K438DRAFT_1984621 [Mycena galopus ATCC 62051]|nr:hypothetical protein K438DRAFT_1984621 [Mycena galopus ATCC 62051]
MEQIRILDQRISEAHELIGTVTDFLQATTLPQVRKLLYHPHNPLPYIFRAAHLQNATARLELWSRFPSVIKDFTDALPLFPPAMMKIRQFIFDNFCCESTSPADKSAPCVDEWHVRALLDFVVYFSCHIPGAARRITIPTTESTTQPAPVYSSLLKAGLILWDRTTFLGTTLRMLHAPISDVQQKRALLSHYSDAGQRIQKLAQCAEATIACADRVVQILYAQPLAPADARQAAIMEQLHILDQRISEAYVLTCTVTDFLQATTLPQVRKLLYHPHNPLPYIFCAAHLQTATARLELWSTFPSVITALTDALLLFPPAMMEIRWFISDHFCCGSTSAPDNSAPLVDEHARALLDLANFTFEMSIATSRLTLQEFYRCVHERL